MKPHFLKSFVISSILMLSAAQAFAGSQQVCFIYRYVGTSLQGTGVLLFDLAQNFRTLNFDSLPTQQKRGSLRGTFTYDRAGAYMFLKAVSNSQIAANAPGYYELSQAYTQVGTPGNPGDAVAHYSSGFYLDTSNPSTGDRVQMACQPMNP